MARQQDTRPRRQFANTHPLFIILLTLLSLARTTSAISTALPPTPNTDLEDGDPKPPRDPVVHLPPINEANPAPPDLPLAPRDQQTPDSPCAGSEGQWNCMTSSWQRCAAGRWSVVMQCAAGTSCVPAGLTYDFKVQSSGQGQSSSSNSSSSALRGKRQPWVWLLAAGPWGLLALFAWLGPG